MKRVGVIANPYKQRAADVLRRLHAQASELGLDLILDRETADVLSGCDATPTDELLERADAVIAVGGDGTMLRVVRMLEGRDTPVMGVNIGSLGFLTSVSEEDLLRALTCLARDEFDVSRRTILECCVQRAGETVGCYHALNDIVASSGPSSRVICLDLCIDGQDVTSYVCDGLIVSTPTGSTGHSLSAGGPILTPDTPAWVVSLICPHTLSSRPLVVPDDSRLSVKVARSDTCVLSADGQTGQKLQTGDVLDIGKSKRAVRFIHLPRHSYFSVLRVKLHWSGSSFT